MVITGYGLLWYFFTLAAGASFMYIYMNIKFTSQVMNSLYEDYDYDVEDDYETSVVTIAGKYYEVPKEVAEAITNMNNCAELLVTDLAKVKKKDATILFLEYFNKAKEPIEK